MASTSLRSSGEPLKHMELVFGLELTEVYPSRNIYALIYKLNLGGDEGLSDAGVGWGGSAQVRFLMVLLGIIFMKGNHTTKEEVWKFLSVLGVYTGRRHWIFGEPRRLIHQRYGCKEVTEVPTGAQ